MNLPTRIVIAFVVWSVSFGHSSAQQNVEATATQSVDQAAEPFVLYASDSKKPITELDQKADFRVIGESEGWKVIRFRQPTVPVWVSNQFIIVDAGVAQVNANRLNMRTKPTLNSNVVGKVNDGYRSQVLTHGDEFTQIYAPTPIEFLIPATE